MDDRQLVLQSKKLLYVKIYDELYKRIMDGEFPVGSLLPTEVKLAELMNTSRMTIRQALSLLQEDGLIKSTRGLGTMVTRPTPHKQDGLEKIRHPIYLCCQQAPDNVEVETRLELPTDHIRSILVQKTMAVMIAYRWYQYLGDPIAYTASFIPVESADKLGLDLADQAALINWLEKDAYEMAASSAINVQIAATSSFITNRYELPDTQAVPLIAESLYFNDKHPDLYNKHYLITPDYQISVNGVNR
ncbi:MAG: GntR family transcriptional regulator [Oscillospiraceae bacterium]|nr:GntR family transcriptional regulator [Oscillospiraceae bacterium]